MIDYVDLLGTPYEVLNCSEVVRHLLARHAPDGDSGLPVDNTDVAQFKTGDTGWDRVGTDPMAAEPGDVVLQFDKVAKGHVTLVVKEGFGVTSGEHRGVFGRPLRAMQNVVGVFRRT